MFDGYSKQFQKAGNIRASYQGSEILNEFPIKITHFLDYFCTNYSFEKLSLSKKHVTTA